jgi:exopolysaccharide biosynthesis protein
VTLTSLAKNNTPYFVVDINLKKISDLRTHVQTNNGTYGVNITATASTQVEEAESSGPAVLAAINGDYCFYSGRKGYVIRNTQLLRSTERTDSPDDDFAIYKNGTAAINSESSTTAQSLVDAGVYQNFCFGPALVEDGEVAVSTSTEVDQSTSSNPRTAIGWYGGLHYMFIVSEGRNGIPGFSLYTLASIMQSYGVVTAYNLDGGGSSTLIYGDSLINTPSDGSERKVSDIVYVVNS